MRTTARSPKSAPDATLLGNVRAVGEQIGQHLQTRDDVRCVLDGQKANRLQDTIDAPAQLQSVAARLEMHVAGARRASLAKHALDHVGRIARIGCIKPA
jgi:hypothetical protein